VADDDLSSLADRPGWEVDGAIARYVPVPDGWRARVTRTIRPERSYHRLHVAIIDPGGQARRAFLVTLVGEAVRVAEAQVDARNR
jgi:hypothetical protein